MVQNNVKSRKRKRYDNAEESVNRKNTKLNERTENGHELSAVKEDAPSSEDELEDELEITKSFNVNEFRKKLQNGFFILDLRHFLKTADANPEIVKNYLNIGGSPMELIQALRKIDTNDLNQLTYLFNSLYLTLMEVIYQSKQLIQPSIEACTMLLTNHRGLIENLLNSYQGIHRKCVLKLLTAIVSLDSQFGRDILNTLTIVFNIETMSRFTRHSVKNIKNERESVRTCYIHFILAYLIDGNIALIRNLLDRSELIMTIVSGLMYDTVETVCLVLNTFSQFILKTPQISKTKKVQIFNSAIARELIGLFNWKGPQYFVAMFNRKERNLEKYVNESDKTIVISNLHDFLITLLTSRKHGIAFQSLGYRRIKSNSIQKRVLIDLEKPWANDKKTSLVCEILKACPELTRSYFKTNASVLDPLNKKSNWFHGAEYVCHIISSLNPSIIRVGIQQMNVKETIEIIKSLCMAPEILQFLRKGAILKSTDLRMRHRSCELLYIMFKQCNQYLFEVEKWQVFSNNDMKKIRFSFINHIFVMCPSVENILLSLHETLNHPDDPNIFGHLECVLDLLLIIAKSVPAFIDNTSSVINYINILRPIYDLNREHSSSTRIELKAIKLILTLESKALTPDTDFFEQVVKSLLSIYVFGTFEEQYEVKELLRNVLKITGLFPNRVLEIDLWLEAFKEVNPDTVEEVQDFLIAALKEGNIQDAQSIAFTTNNTDIVGRNISELFKKIENEITLSGTIDTLTMSYFLQFTVTKHDEDMPECCLDYLELVAFYLFHYLPTPDDVQDLMKSKNHRYSKYMKSWSKSSKPGHLITHKSELFKKFYLSVLSKQPVDFLKIFGLENSDVLLTIGGNEQKVDPSLKNEIVVMLFIYVTIFVVVQLNEQEVFDEAHQKQTTAFLKQFIEILNQITKTTAETSVSGFEGDEVKKPLQKAFQYIFCNRFYFLDKFDICDNGLITMMVVELIEYIKQYLDADQLDPILLHYQSKITNQIEKVLTDTTLESTALNKVMTTVSTISLKSINCITILNGLSKLDARKSKFTNINGVLYVNVLAYCINRLSECKTDSLEKETFTELMRIYIDINRLNATEIELEPLDEAFVNYLTVFYETIGWVSKDLFNVVFETEKLTKSATKLATLLLDRNSSAHLDDLIRLLPKHFTRKELIYPLLNVACHLNVNIDSTLLNSIYDEFKNGITKAIEKPHKAGQIYRENIYSSLWLIERCMPLNECYGFCKKNLKFDSAELFQLQIIKAIHLKALISTTTDQMQIFINFINISMQLGSIMLKKDIEFKKIEGFAAIIFSWFNLKHKLDSLASISYEKVTKSPHWTSFGKSCLKFGVQSKPDQDPSILLKLFGYLCDCLYPNGTTDEDVVRFFEMALSHSEFLDVTLNQKSSNVKTYLMYVLFVLNKKDPSPLKANQIPIFLGSYQAKLSRCDRFILAILQQFEQSGVSMHEYKPFIWGESAISYYSLKKSTEGKMNMIQEPPMMQALSLIDREVADITLDYFPVWRRLNAISQTPSIEFISKGVPGNAYMEEVSIATTEMEKYVSRNEFDADLAVLGHYSEHLYDNVYDPAFYIPLMSMAFAPETYTRPLRPAQNGLLAITFAALSSLDKDLRLATGNALSRYNNHMRMAKFMDNKVWCHLFDSVQRGLADLTAEQRKFKKSRIPRVPYVAGVFLARTINTLLNPLSEMYRPLSSYLLLKNTFDFLTVPEFNVLFQSPEVNHVKHRQFMLEVIRDGIKCGSDFTILMSQSIFKALLGFYDSPMSSREINLLILSVINAAVKIPKSTKILIKNVGLIPWLNGLIDNVEFFQFDVIDGICTIISNIWYSVKFNHEDYGNVPEIEMRIFNLLLQICPKLSTKTEVKSFAKFLNIFHKVLIYESNYRMVTETNIDHLITCCRAHLKEEFTINLTLAQKNGGSFCDNKSSYVKHLRSLNLDEMLVFINATMRLIIIEWIKSNK